MKFTNPLIVVADLERSRAFYREVMGLRVISDFGANITLTGGVSLQTRESWEIFIQKSEKDIRFGGNDAELYFEEDDLDSFLAHLKKFPDIEYVHELKEHSWGQRAVRFYDPDHHIIEVGENLKIVCRRFFDGGMSVEQIQERTMLPARFIQSCAKK